MSDQGKRLMFFNFSDSKAKKFVGKNWQIILPVTKFFTDEILSRLFYTVKVTYRNGIIKNFRFP